MPRAVNVTAPPHPLEDFIAVANLERIFSPDVASTLREKYGR
jgi:hypothetical protein